MSSSHSDAALAEEPGGDPRRIGAVRQGLGLSGLFFGMDKRSRKVFRAGYIGAAAVVGVINILNVLTEEHDLPHINPIEPPIWEGSSWLSLLGFFWIVWLAWRAAPFWVRPRWKLMIHVPAAFFFSLGHVAGFVGLRILTYRVLGGHYHVGHFWRQFLYELRKDSFGYLMFLAGFALIEHLLRRPQLLPASSPTSFDIRDGAKLTRVALSDILAVSSAGNYVEFVLADGRRLLMRKPLSAVESDLEPAGFVRTHRSWLVNAARVTALKPGGSGDYEISLGTLEVPLSRRFKPALAKLRGG